MSIYGTNYLRLVNLIRCVQEIPRIYNFTIKDIIGVHHQTGYIVSYGPLSQLPLISRSMRDDMWHVEMVKDEEGKYIAEFFYKGRNLYIWNSRDLFEKAVVEYFQMQSPLEYTLLFGSINEGDNAFIAPAPWNMSEIGLHSLPASREMFCQNVYLYSEYRRLNILTTDVNNTQHRKLLMDRFSLN